MTTANQQLSKRGAQPDPSAWLDLYGDYLFRYVMVRLRDAMVAEDVVQETLLAAIMGYATYRGESSERTWLVGILRHKILDRLREMNRRRPLDELAHHWDQPEFDADGHWHQASAPIAWRAEPFGVVEQKEFWIVLSHGLSSLPARTAAAFVLREIDGLATDEICRALNVSRENLWVLLHRARMSLRRFLETNWFAASKPSTNTAVDSSRIDGHLPIPTAVRFAEARRLRA